MAIVIGVLRAWVVGSRWNMIMVYGRAIVVECRRKGWLMMAFWLRVMKKRCRGPSERSHG